MEVDDQARNVLDGARIGVTFPSVFKDNTNFGPSSVEALCMMLSEPGDNGSSGHPHKRQRDCRQSS